MTTMTTGRPTPAALRDDASIRILRHPHPPVSDRFRYRVSSGLDDRGLVTHWFHCVIMSTSSALAPIENIEERAPTKTPHTRETDDSDDMMTDEEKNKIWVSIQRVSARTPVNARVITRGPADDSGEAAARRRSRAAALSETAKRRVSGHAELLRVRRGAGKGGHLLCSSDRIAAPSASTWTRCCARAAGSMTASRRSSIYSPARPRGACSSAVAAARRPHASDANTASAEAGSAPQRTQCPPYRRAMLGVRRDRRTVPTNHPYIEARRAGADIEARRAGAAGAAATARNAPRGSSIAGETMGTGADIEAGADIEPTSSTHRRRRRAPSAIAPLPLPPRRGTRHRVLPARPRARGVDPVCAARVSGHPC